MDYNSGPYFIRFIPGVMKILINISVTDDDILEGNETFVLNISHDSLSNNNDINIVIGNYSQTTVSIVDTTSE